MAARDELIKVGESLKVLQPMIDISADRLNGLRTQCATSVDLTRQEIRTLEGKLLKMFAQQLVIKSQLRGEAATVFRDVPSVRQWLQVVGLQKESIDGVCECVDSLEALQEKTDRDLSVILTERNAKRDEFRRLNHALFNLKRYTDILKRGDTNGDEPSDQALYWDSWDRQRGHKPSSGGLSPHPSSRNRSEHIRQGGNLNDDVPSYEDDDGREYNSSDGSISSIASFVQSPPPTPPVITKSRVFGGTEKHKQPSTPPPHQKHRTGGRTNDVGLLPGSFPLTKSKSHESQLSARAPDESDSSSLDLSNSRGPTRRGRLPTEPGFVSATNRGSNSPLDANSTGASVTESRTASPVPSPPPSIVMSCRPVVVRTPRCVVNERIACPTIRDIVIPPATSPVTCTSKTASPSTTPNHGFRDRDVPSTPGPITPRRTPSPNTPNAYSFVSPSTISPIASSPVGVSPSSLGPILCGTIATSPTATKRICGHRPSGAASPHTPRSKFADSSPATPRGSNSSGASPAFVSPVKSPATPGTDTEDVDGSQPSLRVPKSPHKTVIGTGTVGGPGNVPRSMRHCIAHHFTKMYVMIERCDYCHRQMLFATGVRCKECKYMCHRECEEKVPPACGLPSELVDVFKWTISPGVPPSQSPNPGPTPTSSPNHHHSNPFVSLRKKERERKRPHPQPSINVAPFIGQDSSSNTSSCNSSTPSSPALLSVHTPLSVNMIHFNFPEVDRGITLETHPLEVLSETRTSNDSDKTTSACGSGSGGSGSTDSERTPVRVDSQESQVSDSEVVNERENQRWPRQNSQLSMREWDIPFDELKIGEPIGTGRFGTVYRGNWHGDVAIKVLNMDYLDGDKALEAFKSEVGTFRKTRHENLVLFMGACMNPPRLAIVTSLSKGMTLYTHVHLRKDKFNMNKATIVAQQICQGMGYLHARGIVHKDLKSKNIFLENGKVVITDFGLFSVTKLCFGDGESNSLNIPPGWLCYLAPEIVRSLRADQSHRHYELLFSKASDIYAFGTVWYELLCGEWPFKGQAPESVIWQVGKGMKQPLANLQASRDVKDILMLCWAFRPSDRKDFGELFNLLEKLPKKRLARSPSHPVHLSRSAESVF